MSTRPELPEDAMIELLAMLGVFLLPIGIVLLFIALLGGFE